MERLRAPTPSPPDSFSPPSDARLGESVGFGMADLDPPAAVQLASQASHLTLSTSGNSAEEQEGNPPRMSLCASRTPSPISAPSTLPSTAGYQHPPGIEQGGGAEGWRKGAAVTRRNGSIPDALPSSPSRSRPLGDTGVHSAFDSSSAASTMVAVKRCTVQGKQLLDLPNEVLFQILSNLEVCDLLATSRASHLLRCLALSPVLQRLRLRHTRAVLPPLLTSPSRPSLADLIRRHIFLTNTTVVSRKLARNLVAIRLQRRLAARPSPEALVERCVLPPECVPYGYYVRGSLRDRSLPGTSPGSVKAPVAPALVAKRRAVERERVKDGLRRWVGSVWTGEVRSRGEGVRRREERVGIGRVWKLRRFWERVASGEAQAPPNW